MQEKEEEEDTLYYKISRYYNIPRRKKLRNTERSCPRSNFAKIGSPQKSRDVLRQAVFSGQAYLIFP